MFQKPSPLLILPFLFTFIPSSSKNQNSVETQLNGWRDGKGKDKEQTSSYLCALSPRQSQEGQWHPLSSVTASGVTWGTSASHPGRKDWDPVASLHLGLATQQTLGYSATFGFRDDLWWVQLTSWTYSASAVSLFTWPLGDKNGTGVQGEGVQGVLPI